jgi:hypothetical protein
LIKPNSVIKETSLNLKSTDVIFDDFSENEKLKITPGEIKEINEIKSRTKKIWS